MSELLKYVLLLCVAVAAAGSQYFLKIGLDAQQTDFSSPVQYLLSLLTNIRFMTAVVLYIVAFGLYIVLLSRMQVTRLYPISLGLNFILITSVAWWMLREPIHIGRLIGMGCIVLGVYLVERF